MAFKKCENFERDALFDLDFKTKDIRCSESYFCHLDPFSTKLESGEAVLIVGFYSSFIRMCRERDTGLDNKPIALIFRRFTPTGKFRKDYFIWYNQYEPKTQEFLPSDLWRQFYKEYESHPASKLRAVHRQELALIAAKEYSGYGWSHWDIPSIVFRNMEGTNFTSLLQRFRTEREERIAEAHNSVLENYAKFHEGSSWVNSMFNVMGESFKYTKPSEDYVQRLRRLNIDIKRLKREVYSGRKYEDFSTEYMEMKRKESEFNSIIRENQDSLPRHNIGFINWKQLLCEDI